MQIGHLTRWQTIWRIFLIQASFNRERMMSMGLSFCLLPGLRKIHGKKNKIAESLKRYSGFFNTQPYVASILVGALLRLEAAVAEGSEDAELVERFKLRMSQSLAALGDQFFWFFLKPISAMIGIVVSFWSPVWGVTVLLLLYNLPHLLVRVVGLYAGERLGFEIATKFTLRRIFPRVKLLQIASAFVLGVALIHSGLFSARTGLLEVTAFAGGALLTAFLVKRHVSVPATLLLIMLLSLLVGSVYYYGFTMT